MNFYSQRKYIGSLISFERKMSLNKSNSCEIRSGSPLEWPKLLLAILDNDMDFFENKRSAHDLFENEIKSLINSDLHSEIKIKTLVKLIKIIHAWKIDASNPKNDEEIAEDLLFPNFAEEVNCFLDLAGCCREE